MVRALYTLLLARAGGFRTAAPTRRAARAARAAAAGGDDVDPFGLVRDDLKTMKLRIKALVEGTLGDEGQSGSSQERSHPLLQEAAREFFERRERAFRPAVVLLVARAVEGKGAGEPVSARQCLLAEIVEMMCTAQIVHDSVLEDGEEGRKGNVAHRTYSQNAGNKVSVLAGDFLLARCSVALSQLGDLQVVELMATALESMVTGGVLQARAALEEDFSSARAYEARTELKTAALVADACRSAAILAGEPGDGPVAAACYEYARRLGLGYQVMADCISFEGADPQRPLRDLVTGPVVLAAAAAPACREAVAVALEADAPLASVLPQIEGLKGVEAARALARTYAADAVAALAPLPDSEEKRALARMALYVAQDDQVGLQREKYIQAEAKRVRLHAA